MYAVVRYGGGGCQDPRGGVRSVTLAKDLAAAKGMARSMIENESKKLGKWYISEPLAALVDWDGVKPINLFIDVDFEYLDFDGVSIVPVAD